MWTSYLTGMVVCGGIIVAIGAQNAYILGQAIRREYHWVAAAMCMVADLALLTAGMFGLSKLLSSAPTLMDVVRWLGVAFLGVMAAMALWRAAMGRQALTAEKRALKSLSSVVLTTLAVTLLNPQVYLDTLLLIPSIGAHQASQLGFLAGAGSASVLWFSLVAIAGASLSPVLSKACAWRVIDGVIGVMMAVIAVQLAAGGISPA